jgi:tyrosine-protein phosphatase non-receptor type 23
MTYGTSFYINAAASAATTLPADAGTSLQEMCKNHATVVSETRTATQKDNDLIYHALVPSEASLPVIEKAASVAEPIPIQEIYATPEVQKLVGQDIFIKLVPLSVIESSSLYSEEKAKILRTEGARCDMADGEMQALLEHLGLPGNLAKFRATGAAGAGDGDPMATMADPGGQVRAWSNEVRDSESFKRTDAYITELSSLRDKASADLDYCSRELDTEQRDCEQARVKYDYLFEQSPSAGHTKSWRIDIKNDREALGQARASDDQVLSLWASVREDVNALAAGEQVIEGVFSDAIARVEKTGGQASSGGRDLLDLDLPDEEGEEMSRRIGSIEENLMRLTKLKQERNDVLHDLKERVHNDDISQLLILNRKSQNVEPTLFAAELEKFRPHQARIQATISMQQSTLQQIQTVYNQLASGKKGKEIKDRFVKVERAKKELIARYKRAHDAYLEIRTGVTKGTEFYRELAGLVSTLRSEVSQFVSARAAERSQMLANADMKQRMSQGDSNAQTSSLDRSFSSLSLGQPPSHRQAVGTPQPQSPTRGFSGTTYPSMSASQQPPPSQPSYSPYGGPPPPRPVSTASYASGTPYPSSSTPSLPPKPSSQSTAGPAPYRQPSISGLPPPPSHPQYSYQAPAIPPPPSNLSYSSSSSSYASPVSAQAHHLPPPLASYASPLPPPQSQPSYPNYASGHQQPNLPPRPPPNPPSQSQYAPSPAPSQPPYSGYNQQPAYNHQNQPQYQSAYPTQQQQQPYQTSGHAQSQYGAPSPPQQNGYQSGQPQQQQQQQYPYQVQQQQPQPRYR